MLILKILIFCRTAVLFVLRPLTHLFLFLFTLPQQEKPPSPEVATFTVFFMAFTAVVGKELMGMNYDSEGQDSKTILSTYSHASTEETDSEAETAVKIFKTYYSPFP